MRNWLILSALLVSLCSMQAVAKDRVQTKNPLSSPNEEMQFSYEAEGLPCPEQEIISCRIVAKGVITHNTPQKFTEFLIKYGLSGPSRYPVSIMLSSPGGDLTGALALGRQIYALKFQTYLGIDHPGGIACPGSELLAQAHRMFPKLQTDFPKQCVKLVSVQLGTQCESACTFVFAAGRRRALGYNFLLVELKDRSVFYSSDLTDSDNDPVAAIKGKRQGQLGFHAMDPQVTVPFDRQRNQDVLRLGAVWGQREQIKVSAYLREIGLSPTVLDFTARAPNGRGDYYYPSILELEQAGILSVSGFSGWDLAVVGQGQMPTGAMLAARNRNPDSETAQIAIFCSRRANRPGGLFLALSRRFGSLLPMDPSMLGDQLPPGDAEALGGLGLDSVSLEAGQSIPGNDLAFRISQSGEPEEMQWSSEIRLDSRIWFSGAQYFNRLSYRDPWVLDRNRSHPALIKTQSEIAKNLWFNHLILEIVREKVPEFLAAQNIMININSMPGDEIELKLDDGIRRKLNLVRNNCLP